MQTTIFGGDILKEQYVQAIKTIIVQFTTDIGDDVSLTTTAETTLDSGLRHVQHFCNNPGSAAILNMITELGTADAYTDKIIAIMGLAFALGTMKIPTDVSIGFFDELLSLLFTAQFAEITAMKAMMASMYETATHNSPF